MWIDFRGWSSWNLFSTDAPLWDLVLFVLYHHCMWALSITVISMPLETAWSSSFQSLSRWLCGGGLVGWFVCSMCLWDKRYFRRSIDFFFFILFFLREWFLWWKSFYQSIFSFWKLSDMPLKKGRCWYSFSLFFKVYIEQWLWGSYIFSSYFFFFSLLNQQLRKLLLFV